MRPHTQKSEFPTVRPSVRAHHTNSGGHKNKRDFLASFCRSSGWMTSASSRCCIDHGRGTFLRQSFSLCGVVISVGSTALEAVKERLACCVSPACLVRIRSDDRPGDPTANDDHQLAVVVARRSANLVLRFPQLLPDLHRLC